MTRICTTCKKELPATTEYFVEFTDKRSGKRLLKAHCRECGKIKCKQWRDKNKDRYLQYARDYWNNGKGKEADKKFKAKHKGKISAYKKEYRIKNADSIKDYNFKRRTSEETREHVLSMKRRWASKNKIHIKNYNAEYVSGNLEYFRQKTQEREAKKKWLENTLTLAEWEFAKEYFSHQCAYCGKALKRIAQDHFIPLSKGGGYTANNIIPCCKSCNSSKHDNDCNEWYKKQPFYELEREQKISQYIDSMTIPR